MNRESQEEITLTRRIPISSYKNFGDYYLIQYFDLIAWERWLIPRGERRVIEDDR